MDFDITWVLLGLPIAFALGWAASRMDLRQLKFENRDNPKAYFRGLNFLLNEQQDQAIDAFIEAVQNDPDTSELHFALGNLFRRRGEYERAVRVHEHLLSRGDLSKADLHRAQHALALDFLKAGLLDRAEAALLKLEGTAFEQEARLALLANYERSRDWAQAAVVAGKLEQASPGSFSTRLAHYLCEEAHAQAANPQQARALLEQAIAQAPGAPRARLALAQMLQNQEQHAQALEVLRQAMHACASATPLIAPMLAASAKACGQTGIALQELQAAYAQAPCLDVLEATVGLLQAQGMPTQQARQAYVQHLEKEPSLVAASHWLAGEQLEHEQFHPLIQRALDQAVKPLRRYRCAACGFEAQHHFWHCPGCQAWDSYPARRVEEL